MDVLDDRLTDAEAQVSERNENIKRFESEIEQMKRQFEEDESNSDVSDFEQMAKQVWRMLTK